jgi:hypothetical protein
MKKPVFTSEDAILDHEFDEDDVFSSEEPYFNPKSNSRDSKVPDSVMRFYAFSDEERDWARRLISERIQREWISWDNRQNVIGRLHSEVWDMASDYKKQKFALFERVADKFSRSGKSPGVLSRVFLGESKIPYYSPHSLRAQMHSCINELRSFLENEITEQVKDRVSKSYGLTREDWRAAVGNRWQPLGPRPIIPPGGLTPKEAESYVSQMLKFYGLSGAKITRFSRDGGVDVESDRGVFQVKHQKAPVGVGVVREILGVASSKGKRAGVFAKTGFTKEATDFAETNGIVLFSYTPSLKGRTKISEQLLISGFETF